MSPPRSRHLAAMARLSSGLTVLMSTSTLPALMPARMPSGPSVMAASAFESLTEVNKTSDAAATARGESAQSMPLSRNGCALSRVRL